MNTRAGPQIRRIATAALLSLLVHSLILWQLPGLSFPKQEEPLPPLQARLEALPKLAKKPAIRTTKRRVVPPIMQETIAAAPVNTETAASGLTNLDNNALSAAQSVDSAPPEKAPEHRLLPKHAQLHFAVQYHAGTFKLGEIVHTLDITASHYILRAETQTTGLVGLFKNYHLTQVSTGSASDSGLQPDSYTEVKTDNSGTKISTTRFDWKEHTVHFGNGEQAALPDHAQDMLSLPYHLSQHPLGRNYFPVVLSNGKKLSRHYLSVGNEENIHTTMGELRTVKLQKLHGDNEEGLIIWLALEYRLLPVKILYLNKTGEVTANMVITDIRVSDE